MDEFLEARVPIQLGGMQDPFSPMEETRGVTLDLLRVLAEHKYPTLISTKGSLFLGQDYMEQLLALDAYVRLSAAAVPESARARIDAGTDSFRTTLRKIRALTSGGLTVSLRIQPVFPGFETVALSMAEQAAAAGAAHVSFEYLKFGTEGLDRQRKLISDILGIDVYGEMERRGMKRLGRDYTLVADAKRDFLAEARETCRTSGLRFGAGDTEFIHLSDGDGCCNGSSFHFSDATQFNANFVGLAAPSPEKSKTIRLDDIEERWHPQRSVHTYLTTDSRSRDTSGRFNSWKSLMAHRWNGGRSPYSPELFFGVEWTGEVDEAGFRVYKLEQDL